MLRSHSAAALAVPAVVVLSASLAGCGGAATGGAGSLVPQYAGGGSPVSRARMNTTSCSSKVVYVTSYNNSVYVYDQRHNGKTPCGQITGVTNPQGLFVDKQGNLWVAISGDCKTQFSSVLEFAPGSATPIKTLADTAGPATD